MLLLLIIQSLSTQNSEFPSRNCNVTTTKAATSKTINHIERTCLYAILLSFLLLLLSRYFIKCIIWSACIGTMFILCVLTIVVWKEPHLLIQKEWAVTTIELYMIRMILTISLLVGATFLIIYRREIRLVGYLFEEISKESARMSTIIIQPILTCLVAVMASYFIKNLVIVTENHKMTHPQILSLILYIWFINFIYGCQNFIIAGIVSKQVVKQDKINSKYYIWSIFFHLIHFHLGSICCGRFITMFKPVIMIIDKFCGSHKQKFDHLFLSDTLAHIITVNDATKYTKSSKTALRVVKKFDKIFKLSKFGTYTLLFIQLVIIACSIGIAVLFMDLNDVNIQHSLLLSILMTTSTSYCFISAYNAMIESTIFCFFLNFETSRWCIMSKPLTNIFCDLIKYYDIQYDNDIQSKVQDDFINNNFIVMPFPSDYDLTGHFATGTYSSCYVPPPTLMSLHSHSDESSSSVC
ncbi:choline transporter-like protein 1 isoform X2 [Chironomus tepperi]